MDPALVQILLRRSLARLVSAEPALHRSLLPPPSTTMSTSPFGTFGRVFTRAFSSTPALEAKHAKKRIEHMLRNAPPYPAPVPHTFKQAWFGLYGGRHIQFGNNVPDSEYKTRRYWLPNASNKKVWSRALGRYIELRIAKGVLRTIDKVGGIDEYLLGQKQARIKELGPTGWLWRWRVINSEHIQAKWAEEKKRLGLPEDTPLRFEEEKEAPAVEEQPKKKVEQWVL